MKSVPLILGGDNDPHIEKVTISLRKKGVVPIFLNKARLVAQYLTSSKQLEAFADVSLDTVTSIWNRRSLPLILPKEMKKKWKEWCEQEYSQSLLGLLYRLEAHWVSDHFNIKRASLKSYQLKVAKKVGKLNVPNYVITSDSSRAKKFVYDTCLGKAIVKPLGIPVVSDSKQMATIYTNRTTKLTTSDWKGLKYAPCIFQELVDKTAEIRITVVGDKIFPAKIHINSLVRDVDYRKVDPYKLKHEVIKLPKEVAKGSLAMMNFYGLRFAAFDFLLDKNNTFQFLEMNPNGQWLWIEELTGMPISDAIADELCINK